MRRKIWSFILIVSMLLVLTPNTAMAAKRDGKSLLIEETAVKTETTGSSSTMEGNGTETAPYRIASGEQLRAFADMVNGVGGTPNTGLCAVLTQNIDLSGVCGADIGSWKPIGTKANPYTGIFDGESFTVTGLYFQGSKSSYAGLFGCNAGMIKNLGITGADIAAGNYTGGICGFNSGTVTGCYHAASVKGDRYTGGVCGYNSESGFVTVCYNTGAVSGSKYVGGVCGYNKNEISSCYNTGTVSGTGTSVGGVCGYNKNLLSSCHNIGEVNGGGKNYVGSVCGYNYSKAILLNCYYLITGTEKGNYGVAMTQEQFASGEVCWLLNDGKSESGVWRQTTGAGFPTFGGKVIYQVKQRKTGGDVNETIIAYANEKAKTQAASNTASGTVSAQSNDSDSSSDENTDGHNYQEPEWKWKEYRKAKAVFTCLDCGEELILEAKISKEEKKATCTEDGETVYRASVERGDTKYEDKKVVKYQKTEHPEFVRIEKGPGNCVEPEILLGCYTCTACGKYFEDIQGTREIPKKKVEIPAKGHKYEGEPEWSWDENKTPPTATATFECSVCHEPELQEATVTYKSTASCTSSENIVYTAVVKFKNKSYRDEKVIGGKPAPHSYGGPTWVWAEDYSNATATFTCKKCGHTESVSDVSPAAEEKRKPACNKEGETKCTAEVEFEGKKYSNVKNGRIPKTDHSYGEPIWAWAEDGTATAKFTCKGCKASESVQADVTITNVSGTTCDAPGKVTYEARVTFNGKDYPPVSKTVTVSGEHALSFYAAKPATCEKEGNIQYWQCALCQKMFSDAAGTKITDEATVTIPKSGHKLLYGSDGKYTCTGCNKTFTVVPEGATVVDPSKGDTTGKKDEGVTEEKKEDSESGKTDGSEGEPEKPEQGELEGEPQKPEQSELGGEPQKPSQGELEGELQKPEQGEAADAPQEPSQSESGGENQEPSQSEPGGEGQETVPSAQDEENISSEQDGYGEDGGAIANTSEDIARYGLIYPEAEEAENDPMTMGVWEENAVNLRAESAGNSMAQAVGEQKGRSLWISAAALAVLAGVVLFFALKRKKN